MLSDDKKQKLIDKLGNVLPHLRCPMCGNDSFTIADGYTTLSLSGDFKSVTLGGSHIPNIPIICNKCGFVSLHAVGVLGLLDGEKEAKDG